MSHKNNVHGIDVGSDQSAEAMNYRRLFLFALGVAMVIALVGLVASLGSSTSTSTSSESAIPYSNALEMQYAQPWLDKQAVEAAPAVRYSDALAMQYAQPWLDAQKRTATSVTYSDALAMEYAQPWLDAQKSDSDIQYGNGMALFYALQNGYRPTATAPSCNDRADWLYACQNSSWRPGE